MYKTKDKKVNKKANKTWIIINTMDGNDSFEVEAKTIKEAAFAALSELGWGVDELPKEEEEDLK